MQLGPILQEMTEISIRYDVPLPASLALTGKALAQMQLATAELDPDLDPFDVAGSFLMRSLVDADARAARTRRSSSTRRRSSGSGSMHLIEAVERLTGARPGPNLQVNFGAEELETTIRRTGRRLALGITAGAAILATALTAVSLTGWPGGVPQAVGVISAEFCCCCWWTSSAAFGCVVDLAAWT